MKNTRKTAALLVFIAMFFVGCSKNMDYPDPLQEEISSGQFTVSYFFEGQEKTASYGSYVFEFQQDGKLVCHSSSVNYSGNWQLLKKVEGQAINIMISAPSGDLQNLIRQWDVVDAGNSMLALKQSNTVLQFSKK